ncbi:hypothetical protein T492DRAFT_105159 [Pavlovales sp. CCMP2436]|nr:hypothetical protein T492DRAFT_105159 [Pavlovales sp. CCMP2436]
MGDAALRPAQHSEQSDASLNPFHKYNDNSNNKNNNDLQQAVGAQSAAASGRGTSFPPAPFLRAVPAAAAEGGVWLTADSQPRTVGGIPDLVALRVALSGLSDYGISDCAVSDFLPTGLPEPQSGRAPPGLPPGLACSRAALACLSLDVQYMATPEYATSLLRAKILDANPHIPRAPRPDAYTYAQHRDCTEHECSQQHLSTESAPWAEVGAERAAAKRTQKEAFSRGAAAAQLPRAADWAAAEAGGAAPGTAYARLFAQRS